jgi:hypothetical protein
MTIARIVSQCFLQMTGSEQQSRRNPGFICFGFTKTGSIVSFQLSIAGAKPVGSVAMETHPGRRMKRDGSFGRW